jgi:hypothetical protein
MLYLPLCKDYEHPTQDNSPWATHQLAILGLDKPVSAVTIVNSNSQGRKMLQKAHEKYIRDTDPLER